MDELDFFLAQYEETTVSLAQQLEARCAACSCIGGCVDCEVRHALKQMED